MKQCFNKLSRQGFEYLQYVYIIYIYIKFNTFARISSKQSVIRDGIQELVLLENCGSQWSNSVELLVSLPIDTA